MHVAQGNPESTHPRKRCWQAELAGTLARCLCHEGNLTLLAARPNQSVHIHTK